jgi:hypothetical protein
MRLIKRNAAVVLSDKQNTSLHNKKTISTNNLREVCD